MYSLSLINQDTHDDYFAYVPGFNKYKIHPFRLVNVSVDEETASLTTYNYTVPLHGPNAGVSLFHSKSSVAHIWRVMDFVCFSQLVDLLNESNMYIKLREMADIAENSYMFSDMD